MFADGLSSLLVLASVAAVGVAVGLRVHQHRLRRFEHRLSESERLRFELLRQNTELKQRLDLLARGERAPREVDIVTGGAAAGPRAPPVVARPATYDATLPLARDEDPPRWEDTQPASSFVESSAFPATQPSLLRLKL
jgi:hypothetical protein